MIVDKRVRFKPRPNRDWEKYAGQTGTVIYHTTDGFFRVKWDRPVKYPYFFNLERVFDREDLELMDE